MHEINKVRLPYNIDSITQYVATEALNKFYPQIKKFISEIIKERQRVYKRLLKIKKTESLSIRGKLYIIEIKE